MSEKNIKQLDDTPKCLLHICCVGCGAYVAEVLKQEYNVTLYFYNPSIFPRAEHDIRRDEAKKVALKLGLPIIFGDYDHTAWLASVRGLEQEPEKGKRCHICYKDRLNMTANRAKDLGAKYFTTTLSVSPHKDAKRIIEIGEEMAEHYDLKFIAQDFKKKDGFKKACDLSQRLGLYRQDYCGCEFSMRRLQNTEYTERTEN